MLWQMFGRHQHRMHLRARSCRQDHDRQQDLPCVLFTSKSRWPTIRSATPSTRDPTEDDVLNHFDSSGTILDSTHVVPHINGLAFNPATGHLFVLHQIVEPTGPDVYVVDPKNNYALTQRLLHWSPGNLGRGLGAWRWTADGHLWLVSSNPPPNFDFGFVLEVDSGEASTCNFSDVPWLSEIPTSGYRLRQLDPPGHRDLRFGGPDARSAPDATELHDQHAVHG